MNLSDYTDSQIADLHAAIDAAHDGKPIQVQALRGSDEWLECPQPLFNGLPERLYRPKLAPAVVPWSMPSHVPGPVCWLREPDIPDEQSMVVGIGPCGVDYIDCNRDTETDTWEELRKAGVEYSTDRITWKPCTVEVQP